MYREFLNSLALFSFSLRGCGERFDKTDYLRICFGVNATLCFTAFAGNVLKRNSIIFVFLSFFTTARAQENETIQKLELKISQQKNDDTTTVKLINDLAWEYAYFDPKTSIQYCRKAIRLSQQLSFPDGEAFAYNTLGDNYRTLSKYDSAFFYLDKALTVRRAQNKKDKIAAVLVNIGNIYNQQKNYINAILKYKEAIRIGEEAGHKKAVLVALTNMADVYRAAGSYDKAMEAMNKALDINKIINDTLQLSYIYATMAQLQAEMKNPKAACDNGKQALKLLSNQPDVYLKITVLNNLGSYYRGLNMWDSALSYFSKALELETQTNDSIGLGITNNGISILYKNQGQLDLCLLYANQSRIIAKEIRDTALYSNATFIIADVYSQKKDYKKALTHALEVIPFIKRINNKTALFDAYYSMANIYGGLNQHEKRGDFLELAYAYKDSSQSEENNKTATRLNIELDVYGKEKEIELLNKTTELNEAELTKQKSEKVFITWIAGLFGIIVLVIIFFYFKIRKTNTIINKQKERVEQQNDIISNQKHLVEEKQKEIIDSINYAKRIQTAVLTGDDVWKKISKEHFILFKPKDIVSGDFYWAYNAPTGRSVFALADCTGHGVPGGFMSMLGNSFLNEIVVENKIFNAATILNKLRGKIINALEQKGDSQQKDGMDIALCVWNKMNNTLEFAGANNALMILRNNVITEIKPDKMPIGTHAGNEKPFVTQTMQLQTGDCLYMTTDGFPDQFGGPKGKKFKYKQLEELLLNVHQLPMNEQSVILKQKFEEWMAKHEQIDDVSIIGVRV